MSRTRVRLALTLILGAMALPGMAGAQWKDGNDTVKGNHGRFVGWPLSSRSEEKYVEEDLVFRIHPDALERSHRDLTSATWLARFGWTNSLLLLPQIRDFDKGVDGPSLITTEASWVNKEFAVTRYLQNTGTPGTPVADDTPTTCASSEGGTATYLVRVNGVGPGTWITSTARYFYLKYASDFATNATKTGFSDILYPTPSGGLGQRALTLGGLSDMTAEWNPDDAAHNWLILAGPQNAAAAPGGDVVLPLLVSFPPSDQLTLTVAVGINGAPSYFVMDFGSSGTKRDVGLSMPYGARGFTGPTADLQSLAGGWQQLLAAANLCNSMVCNLPVSAGERFDDADPNTLQIKNAITYKKLDARCPTFEYVPVPPLLSLAVSEGIPRAALPPGTQTSPFVTKYLTALQYVPGVTEATYTIPAAPRFDVHAVRNAVHTAYQDMATQMIAHACYVDRGHQTSAFDGMVNRGESFSLGLASPEIRERYVARMRDSVQQYLTSASVGIVNSVPAQDPPDYGDVMVIHRAVMDGAEAGGGWQWHTLPLTCALNVTMLTPLTKTAAGMAYPHDMDATAGTILEYLYEYLLWSDDSSLLNSVWDGDLYVRTEDIYYPLWAFHDWATMGGNSTPWGNPGARLDMLAAENVGHYAFAKLAEHANEPERAAFARYLQAKAQLPMMLRFAASTELFVEASTSCYYAVLPREEGLQVIPGFGEQEASGPLSNWEVLSFDRWADWALSGELIHPLVYEVYEGLYGDRDQGGDYGARLDLYEAYRPDRYDQDAYNQGMLRCTFPENKVYAFARNGRYATLAEAEADVALASTLRGGGANDEGFRVVNSAEGFVNNRSSWWTGSFTVRQPLDYKEAGASRAGAPTPIYAGILESFTVPLRIGSWRSAGLTDAWVDAGEDKLYVVAQRAGTVVLQSDRFTGPLGAGTSYDPVWRTITWEITGAGTRSLDLGVEILPGEAVSARDNLLSYPSFEELGAYGVNLEYGWEGVEWATSGEIQARKAIIGDSGAGPGDSKALQLVVGSTDPKAGYAYQVAYLTAPTNPDSVFYKLTFDYKVPSAGMKLDIAAHYEDDTSCFFGNGVIPAGVPDCDSLPHPQFNAYVNTLPMHETQVPNRFNAALGLATDDVWRPYELRGVCLNPTALRHGATRIQFSFQPNAGTEILPLEALVDHVVLTPVASEAALGLAGFRSPAAGQVIGPEEYVPIAMFPDERVPRTLSVGGNTLGGALKDPGRMGEVGQLQIEFSWWDDRTQRKDWVVISPDEFPYRNGGNGFYVSQSYPCVRPAEWADYPGPTKLRARYYRVVTIDPPYYTLVGSVESPWFTVLPEAPAMVAETPTATGLSLASTSPYGLLNLDYNKDGKTDILVSVPSASGGDASVRLFKNLTTPGQHRATFVDEALGVFAEGVDVPQSARTATAGRIVFGEGLSVAICTPSGPEPTHIYTMSAGRLQLVGSHQLPTAVADSVWAAAFADMDNDGDLDVYLVRAGGFVPSGYGPSPAEIVGHGARDGLLEWTAAGYVDKTAEKLPAGHHGESETIAAAWANVDGDLYPDLFVAHLGPRDDSGAPGWSPLYINHGGAFVDVTNPSLPNPFDLNYADEIFPLGTAGNPGSSAVIARMGYVSGAEWVDVDTDGDPDLVVCRRHPGTPSPEYNLALLVNTGHGRLVSRAGNGARWIGETQGVALLDLDGNGIRDIVGAPAGAGSPTVPILMGADADPGSAIEAVYGAVVSPFDDGVAGAVVGSDYDGDKDVDILLARRETVGGTSKYYYSNPRNPSLQPYDPNVAIVELNADGSGNNELGIGATVRMEYPRGGGTVSESRYVDGGGRAQAEAGRSMFVVTPDSAATLTVRVTWPDGYEQVLTGVTPSDSLVVTDTHYPIVNAASVQGTYTPEDGYTVWKFEWDTTYSCSRHEIGIQKYSGGTACNLPPSFLLTPETEGASLATTWNAETAKFHHVLTWTRECFSPCTYRYTVRSYSSTRVSTSGQKTLSIPACGYIEG